MEHDLYGHWFDPSIVHFITLKYLDFDPIRTTSKKRTKFGSNPIDETTGQTNQKPIQSRYGYKEILGVWIDP